jgi:hypothetical protein
MGQAHNSNTLHNPTQPLITFSSKVYKTCAQPSLIPILKLSRLLGPFTTPSHGISHRHCTPGPWRLQLVGSLILLGIEYAGMEQGWEEDV